MRLAVYGAVLAITLGSVLLGLDWLSAPMSPMADTKAGLRAAAPPPAPVMPSATISAPITPPAPAAPRASIGAPIISPSLSPNPPASAGAAVQATTDAPTATEGPEVQCNVDACAAAYRSFRASDCTYQPSNGPRRLCAK